MRIVGLIPARAGSKRIPKKNLAEFGGRPLIAHTCQAALESGVLSAVYVNTDCPVIASAAERFGVACPVLRPAELASDDAATRDANRFLLEKLRDRHERYDAVAVLQPTSPLRSAGDIRNAVAMFVTHAPCAVVSVSPVAPASWLGRVGRDGRFESLPGNDTVYRLNGAIYIHTIDDYTIDRAPSRTLVYPMPPSRGVDIDTVEDLIYAKSLLQRAVLA